MSVPTLKYGNDLRIMIIRDLDRKVSNARSVYSVLVDNINSVASSMVLYANLNVGHVQFLDDDMIDIYLGEANKGVLV